MSSIDLDQLAALPVVVAQLQARVEALEAAAKTKAEPEEPLVDAAVVAERLGMTAAAVRQAAWRGSIPCHRVGRLLRFRLSELRQ